MFVMTNLLRLFVVCFSRRWETLFCYWSLCSFTFV